MAIIIRCSVCEQILKRAASKSQLYGLTEFEVASKYGEK